jgi:hypothetical protein
MTPLDCGLRIADCGLGRAARRLVSTVTIVLLVAAAAQAERGDAGSNAADFLRLNAGAAAAAQGEAYAGRSGGIEVFPYNPAGLRHVERNEIMLQHNNYIADMNSSYVGGVIKLRNDWRLAGSVNYFDQGRFTRRTISSPTGIGSFEASAIAGSLGVAGALSERISFGLTLKGFSEEIDNAARGGFAADVGLHYRARGEIGTFEAGLVGRNLGPQVRFDVTEEDLPTEFAGGLSVLGLRDMVRLSGEIAVPRNQEAEYRAGLEARPVDLLALRVGYNSRNDLGTGLSAGAGFRYRNFMLDYAWVGYDVAGDAHRMALTVGF